MTPCKEKEKLIYKQKKNWSNKDNLKAVTKKSCVGEKNDGFFRVGDVLKKKKKKQEKKKEKREKTEK